MKKKRIAIASVLKPIDDVRACEKMAMTLAAAGHEVHLFGPSDRPVANLPNVTFHPFQPVRRLSLGRLLIRWKFASFCTQVKPEVSIVNTHELLIVNVLNRIKFGTRLVYDIQENYYLNILHTDAFWRPLRWPLAWWVRWKERVTLPFYRRVVLAEKCYQKELSFVSRKSVVIENKTTLPASFIRRPVAGKKLCIFTGTIDVSTGVLDAIKLVSELHTSDPSFELEIAGYCARKSVKELINEMVRDKPFIRVNLPDYPLPHSSIKEVIGRAHFGIVAYPTLRHTRDRIPTKVYEYLACRLPMLYRSNDAWKEMVDKVDGGVVVDFERINGPALIAQIESMSYYQTGSSETLWATEAPKLLAAIEALD